jgi:hypothetical protein
MLCNEDQNIFFIPPAEIHDFLKKHRAFHSRVIAQRIVLLFGSTPRLAVGILNNIA